MTTREVYDYLLTETNKVEAPSLLLESFNYLLGKAINETCNQWWAFYEQNELVTDNLRVLTRVSTLTNANLVNNTTDNISLGNYYKLPGDYWHILPSNIVTFNKVTTSTFPCKTTIQYPAIKMDSQMYSGIMRDYYTKPSYKRPYLYMHEFIHTAGTPPVQTTYELEIKSGDDLLYRPTTLQIDYLKKPQLPNKAIKEVDPTNIYLTYEELDSDTDISQPLEFPENYCYEIVNKLTALVLEQTGDPRLQNNIPLNQTMVPPKQG